MPRPKSRQSAVFLLGCTSLVIWYQTSVFHRTSPLPYQEQAAVFFTDWQLSSIMRLQSSWTAAFLLQTGSCLILPRAHNVSLPEYMTPDYRLPQTFADPLPRVDHRPSTDWYPCNRLEANVLPSISRKCYKLRLSTTSKTSEQKYQTKCQRAVKTRI